MRRCRRCPVFPSSDLSVIGVIRCFHLVLPQHLRQLFTITEQNSLSRLQTETSVPSGSLNARKNSSSSQTHLVSYTNLKIEHNHVTKTTYFPIISTLIATAYSWLFGLYEAVSFDPASSWTLVKIHKNKALPKAQNSPW